MPRIDSPSNPRIAAAVRAVAGGDRMLLEGKRMVEEALDAGVRLDEVFVLDELSEENEDFLRRLKGKSAGGGGATPAGGASRPLANGRVEARPQAPFRPSLDARHRGSRSAPAPHPGLSLFTF